MVVVVDLSDALALLYLNMKYWTSSKSLKTILFLTYALQNIERTRTTIQLLQYTIHIYTVSGIFTMCFCKMTRQWHFWVFCFCFVYPCTWACSLHNFWRKLYLQLYTYLFAPIFIASLYNTRAYLFSNNRTDVLFNDICLCVCIGCMSRLRRVPWPHILLLYYFRTLIN
jgi:hypothetical protein